MSILHGKMVSSTVFIFATKSGYTAFRKKQGLFHTKKLPHCAEARFRCGKSDVDLAVPLASARRRELGRIRLLYPGPARLHDECGRCARMEFYRARVLGTIRARGRSRA